MTRHEAREFMIFTCYQMDLVGGFDVDRHDEFFKNRDLGKQNNYCEILFSLMCNKKEQVDHLIQGHSEKWDINRIPKIDLAVLRVGVTEIIYMDEIPDSVAINEAIEFARLYGEDASPVYVNGILGAIQREK